MKQLLIIAALLVSSMVHATTDPIISSKVLKSFQKHFAKAVDVDWSIVDKTSVANFEQNNIQTSASFDKQGYVVLVMRYYKANYLPQIVKDALNVEFGKKEIHGVTEINNSQGVVYKIFLKDSKKYYDVLVDDDGNLEVKNIYNRADN